MMNGDFLNLLAESVILSFTMGIILGGAIVAHIILRRKQGDGQ